MIFVTMVCAKYGAAAIQDVRMIKQNTEKWRKSLSKKQQNIYNKALTMCNNGMWSVPK